MKRHFNRFHYYKRKYNKIIGIILGVIGAIIIIQVVPISVWLLILGLLCVLLGWIFFRMI
mgnify:CR=1 FL=1